MHSLIHSEYLFYDISIELGMLQKKWDTKLKFKKKIGDSREW